MSQIGYGPTDVIGAPAQYVVPLTGQTVLAQTGNVMINPAGTLATLVVTLPLNPPDGATVEITSTQILTGLTVNASALDVIVNGVLAAVTGMTPVASGGAGGATGRIAYRYTLNGTSTGVNARTWVRIQ